MALFFVLLQENHGFVVDNFENGGSYNDQLQRLIDDVNDERKITRNNLTLDIDNIIGTGSYGDVIRGNIRLNNANFYSCQCQVHVISEDMEKRDQLSFVNEFGSLIAVGQHPNTLSFFGVCQTADWLYLIFEDTQMTLKRRLLDSRVPPYTNNPRFSTMSEEMAMQFMLTVSQTMEFLVEKKVGSIAVGSVINCCS
jgi:endothelial-specific receptor tyrosine kinase